MGRSTTITATLLQTWSIIQEHGPLTRAKLRAQLLAKGTDVSVGMIAHRLDRLKQLGYVRSRPNTQTGHALLCIVPGVIATLGAGKVEPLPDHLDADAVDAAIDGADMPQRVKRTPQATWTRSPAAAAADGRIDRLLTLGEPTLQERVALLETKRGAHDTAAKGRAEHLALTIDGVQIVLNQDFTRQLFRYFDAIGQGAAP